MMVGPMRTPHNSIGSLSGLFVVVMDFRTMDRATKGFFLALGTDSEYPNPRTSRIDLARCVD